MNANVYEYGTDPISGLPRRLVRDTAVVQEEMDTNPFPSAVVHLRLQTYNAETGSVVTDVTAGYKVTKGQISYDVDGNPLPKRVFNPETGQFDIPINPETGEPYPRDNGYENIILLSQLAVPFDTVLDNGIKEYYKIV